MQKILVVVAHPDDEILGMGGTIAKLVDEGKEVHVLIVTDGSTSQYKDDANLLQIIEDKKKETENANKAVGVSSVMYGGLPDMRLDFTPHVEVNKAIEKAIDAVQPDTIFTHFWGDVNMDHRCVFNSVMVAVRPVQDQIVREVYCFNVPSSTEWSPNVNQLMFMPTVFVDISKYAEQKYQAMGAYVTELREYPHPRSLEYLRKDDEAVGLKVGMGAAEGFVVLRKLID